MLNSKDFFHVRQIVLDLTPAFFFRLSSTTITAAAQKNSSFYFSTFGTPNNFQEDNRSIGEESFGIGLFTRLL